MGDDCAALRPSSHDDSDTRVVVFVSESLAEHRHFAQILNGSVWTVCCLCTCREAVERILDWPTAVVVCDRKLPDGYWTEVLECVRSLGPHPEIVVTARHVDERLWAEVLNLGGSDVLGQPFDPREVIATVSSAWRRWHDRRHGRDRFAARAGGR